MGRRIRWLGLILLACFALVLVQLVNIQFKRANALANSPFNPAVHAKIYDNDRGTISLANGTVLAKSVKINSSTSSYNYKRVYPQGPLYSGITGYDSYYLGTSGIEYEYNSYLTPHAQAPQNLSQLLFNKPPSEPDNVILTIDPVLQQAAATALTTLPPGANKDGAVAVLNPKTGAVLALVSNPTYDPNNLSNPDVKTEEAWDYAYRLPDREGFEPIEPIATEVPKFPGSTFKVITSTAVYNLKPSLINYYFPYAASIGFPDSNQRLFNDGGSACGGTMETMLPQSCDPGYGELGIKLGVPTLTKQAELFGLSIYQGSYTYTPKIDLPSCTSGVSICIAPSDFCNLAPNSQAFLAYCAIGQENDAETALQNALVASAIANNGVMMTPHLMEQIRDSQGNVVTTYKPTPMLKVSSASAAESVNKLMQGVPKPGGTAYGDFPQSWDVAAKTGTAQDSHIVDNEQTDDWLIAFMPASDPQIAVAVVVPYQLQDLTGAQVAGPIVRAVFQAYLNEIGSSGTASGQ
ncbi:MAG TPA: penicillin-binding transpeptidase domain-containing protein [Acidimicrobiales bacterium]|nr:penicillin-binding transpeptidase domain-containing protein [Acidimicrobiales bacterium]